MYVVVGYYNASLAFLGVAFRVHIFVLIKKTVVWSLNMYCVCLFTKKGMQVCFHLFYHIYKYIFVDATNASFVKIFNVVFNKSMSSLFFAVIPIS